MRAMVRPPTSCLHILVSCSFSRYAWATWSSGATGSSAAVPLVASAVSVSYTHLDVYKRQVYVSTSCMHCEDPACATVCPARAITKGEGGVVTVDHLSLIHI